MQGTGWEKCFQDSPAILSFVRGSLVRLRVVVTVDANPVHFASARTWSLPTTGVLFSDTHATTHALQPLQLFRSIAMPQA